MLNVALAHEEARGLRRAREEALFSLPVQRWFASPCLRRHYKSMHPAGRAVKPGHAASLTGMYSRFSLPLFGDRQIYVLFCTLVRSTLDDQRSQGEQLDVGRARDIVLARRSAENDAPSSLDRLKRAVMIAFLRRRVTR